MDNHFMSRTLLLIASLTTPFLLVNAVPSTRPLHIVRHDLLKLCEKTSNPTLCTDTIQPHFHDVDFDPLKALEVEVEATLNQTKKTAAIIADLLAKQDIPESLKGSLNTCKDQYSNIMDSIDDTKKAIAEQDVVDAKFKFSAVLSFQSTCKDEFKDSDFPFADDSDAVFQLGGNCLDMIADMEKSAPPTQEALVPSAPSAFSNVIGLV